MEMEFLSSSGQCHGWLCDMFCGPWCAGEVTSSWPVIIILLRLPDGPSCRFTLYLQYPGRQPLEEGLAGHVPRPHVPVFPVSSLVRVWLQAAALRAESPDHLYTHTAISAPPVCQICTRVP